MSGMPSGPAQDDIRTRAEGLLRVLTDRPEVDFHPGQFEAIEALVSGRRRALVVQRTGWGKSAVYFIASLLLRRADDAAGPTVIISPLLALMRDQVAAAARAGVRAAAMNSANLTEWDQIRQQLEENSLDVLLISPERLNNPRFREEQLPELMRRTGLLVIDEAHCISDWGHDFRPDYRRIAELVAALPTGVPVLATTATANQRVVADIEEQLGAGSPEVGVRTIRGPLARASLRLGVLALADPAERLAWLVDHLGELPGSGIIYTLTVAAAEDTARLLSAQGYPVRAYTGRTDTAEREEAEQLLKQNQVKALVATSALGMGFDKPDLGFVVHLGAPSSPVAYYQQVGRAGRSTESAEVLLLPGAEDRQIWEYFATASMPSAERAEAILAALAPEPGQSPPVLSEAALETRADIRRTPLQLLLKVLAVDGAVVRVPGGWQSTGRGWAYDAPRYQRIAQARRTEQEAMLEYQRISQCRMEFLASALDDPEAARCGRCDNCAGVWFPVGISDRARRAAGGALHEVGVPIEPRAMWPSGMDTLRIPVKGRIPEQERFTEGRALARFTDLGWGGPLRELFADGPEGAIDAEIPQNLLDACVRMLADWASGGPGEAWSGAGRPVAVLSMPSRSRPRLVRSLAEGVAGIGKLPYLGELEVQDGGPQGSRGGNSAYRLAGVWQKFGLSEAQRAALPEAAAVLLVDDLVDSRWSLTVAAQQLRQAGAGLVLPLVLAQAA
ncbi:RecQ family ATP-dependent DNA helicase [Acaricomes phytoseiuli]|uniref:RecQ family ATP-dependent DNA helicase n=1 Tax=Acaricomes phytoseiuli TaxID=291968 RepID=UPI00035E1C68|nr:RecQ family ATP-dependent DNA helicase [Acaricomes phytoseiuli]